MLKQKYIKETNSYYTKKEIDYLELLGFNWSNQSNKDPNGYDTCYYSHKNKKINIEKKDSIYYYMDVTFLNGKTKYFKTENIKDLKIEKYLKRNFLISILFIIPMFIYTIFLILLTPIFYIVFKKKWNNDKFTYFKVIKKIIKMYNPFETNYYRIIEKLTISYIIYGILICLFLGYFFGKI